jgi:hypothetical protein
MKPGGRVATPGLGRGTCQIRDNRDSRLGVFLCDFSKWKALALTHL